MAKEKKTVANTLPELALLWHPTLNKGLTPDEVSYGSGKKIWWQCFDYADHFWEASVANQRKKPRCPFCSGSKILKGFNDLETRYPEVFAELHPTKNAEIDVDSVTPKSAEKIWWLCAEGHEWEAIVFNRTSGSGCPQCAGYSVITGKTDLQTLFPELSKQWHPTLNGDLTPGQVTSQTHRKVWWLCTENHEWEATVGSRARTGGNGCPYCANKFINAGENDLETARPDLAREWDFSKNKLLPSQVGPGSSQKAWWVCSRNSGHSWEAEISNRAKGTGCPFCSNRLVIAGENDLATTHPEVASQWAVSNKILPTEVTSGSRSQVLWQCPTNSLHLWEAQVRTRTSGSGCPYCANRITLSGDNDLATLRPDVAKEWDYEANDLSPEGVSVGSGRKIGWVCSENPGHKWTTILNYRTRARGGSGCPHCHKSAITSRAEQQIYDFVQSLGFSAIKNDRTRLVRGLELDVYIPSEKFAIEFNGLYWHSEKFRNKDAHQRKYQACVNAGITLYQVWEDDWVARKNVILRAIAHRLNMSHMLPELLPDTPAYYSERLGARSTTVSSLNYQEAKKFLDEHHIQGGTPGSHYLGLKDRLNRLRAVLVLRTTGRAGELAIERYATAGVVSGGFTKLLSYAEREFTPRTWVTFADLSVSDGKLYELTGFRVDKMLKPDYSYIVGLERVHKFNYRLKRFRTDPNLFYEDGLTERQLAELNGLERVWDSGKIRFVKDVN